MENPYPFQTANNNGQFIILAALESNDLFKKYYPFFESAAMKVMNTVGKDISFRYSSRKTKSF